MVEEDNWSVIEKDFGTLLKDLNRHLGWFGPEALKNTPKRMTRFYKELKSNDKFNFTTFKVPVQQTKGLVILKDIEFYSLCEHHLLPFYGDATVAYLPKEGGRICGLSKLARTVMKFASKPQLQERLTNEIADYLNDQLDARFVMVVVNATHLCLTMRGARQPEASMITSSLRSKGSKTDSDSLKQEVLNIIGTK